MLVLLNGRRGIFAVRKMARHRYRQSQYVSLTRLQLDEIGRERDLVHAAPERAAGGGTGGAGGGAGAGARRAGLRASRAESMRDVSEALACEGRRGVYMNPSTYTSAVQTVSTAVSNTLPSTVPCVFEVFGGAAPEVLQLPPRRCCSSLRAAGALRAPRRHREKSRHGRLATLFPHTGWSQLLSKEA